MHSWLVGLVALLTVSSCSFAVDYSKIERKLAKEPKYASGKPQYALLVFGREANLRVWVVRDGESLYLDRAGKGDLTPKEHHFAKRDSCTGVTLADPDGKTKYVITGVGYYEDKEPTPRSALMVSVDVQGEVKFSQYCDVPVADSLAKAGLAHFNGPLTAQPRTISFELPKKMALKLGEAGADLPMVIGTLDKATDCWTVIRTHTGATTPAFPKGVVPRVEIEWPAEKAGDPPLKVRYDLNQFC